MPTWWPVSRRSIAISMTRPTSPSCWSTTRPPIFMTGTAGICTSPPTRSSRSESLQRRKVRADEEHRNCCGRPGRAGIRGRSLRGRSVHSRRQAIPRDAANVNRNQEPDQRPTILVAGVGNIFLSDDGFGPEVVRHLPAEARRCPSRCGWSTTGSAACTWPTTCWRDIDALVLVDALPGPRPGR